MKPVAVRARWGQRFPASSDGVALGLTASGELLVAWSDKSFSLVAPDDLEWQGAGSDWALTETFREQAWPKEKVTA